MGNGQFLLQRKEKSITFHLFFPTVVLTLSSCSNLDCSSQGLAVSLSCITKSYSFPFFLRQEHWKQAFSLPVSATAAVVFFLTPSSLWAKQNFVWILLGRFCKKPKLLVMCEGSVECSGNTPIKSSGVKCVCLRADTNISLLAKQILNIKKATWFLWRILITFLT